MNKLEKKREHYSQTLNVEQKTFTPFVFSATGGMRRECPMHVKKTQSPYFYKTNRRIKPGNVRIRYKISYALLGSCLFYIGGCRRVSNEYKNLNKILFHGITIVKQMTY